MSENVTNGSRGKRPRTRCRATTKAGVQCRSTAVSDIDGLCSLHGGRLDPVALGRKGGKARKPTKGKRGSFRTAVRDVLSRDPTAHAERLLSSGAAGYKLASELIEQEEAEEAKAATGGPIVLDNGQEVRGLSDVIKFAYSIGAAHHFGLPETPDELAVLLEGSGGGARGDEGVPPSFGTCFQSRALLGAACQIVAAQKDSYGSSCKCGLDRPSARACQLISFAPE